MTDLAWAQAGPQQSPPALVTFLPLILVFVVFYFLLIRPQQKKERERRMMIANLKKNDKVVTAGGLHGRVVTLGEEIVTLEIAPSVRVEVSRPQISAVLTAPRPEEKGKDGKSKEKEKEK